MHVIRTVTEYCDGDMQNFQSSGFSLYRVHSVYTNACYGYKAQHFAVVSCL